VSALRWDDWEQHEGLWRAPRHIRLAPPIVAAVAPVGTDGHTECTASGTAVTSALPTGFTFNGTQLCLLEVSHGSGASNTTITTPAGWTLLTQPAGASTRLPVFWRFLQSGDTAPSFTLGTSRFWCTHATAFSGVDTGSPINQSSALDYAAATSYASASITPSVDNCMIVVCWGGKTASGVTQTVTIPSPWTDTTGGTTPSPTTPNQSAVAASTNQWATFQYLLQAGAAAVSESVTVGSSATAESYILALKPAAAAAAAKPPLPVSQYSGRW